MQLSRRTLLTSVAPGAVIALAGCTAAQQAQWATIVGQIQTAVAAAAKYIPSVESIAAEAAALFGPQYTLLVTAGSAALNQIIQVLVNVAGALTPPDPSISFAPMAGVQVHGRNAAASKMRARLRAASPSVPAVVGTTPQGVVITGWAA